MCNLYIKKEDFSSFILNNLDDIDIDNNEIVKCFHRFFQEVNNQPNTLMFIPFSDILNKCTLLKFNDSTYLSNLNTTPDHD